MSAKSLSDELGRKCAVCVCVCFCVHVWSDTLVCLSSLCCPLSSVSPLKYTSLSPLNQSVRKKEKKKKSENNKKKGAGRSRLDPVWQLGSWPFTVCDLLASLPQQFAPDPVSGQFTARVRRQNAFLGFVRRLLVVTRTCCLAGGPGCRAHPQQNRVWGETGWEGGREGGAGGGGPG